MKKIYLFNFMLIVLFVACQKKQVNKEDSTAGKSNIPAQLSSLDVVITETLLGDNFEDINFDELPRISAALYDSLQLSQVEELQMYDMTYISMGRILLSSENGKIITIQVITGGEIREYLISYDNKGELVDNMLVAYEDMVEYYSQTSSRIDSNNIFVQTVNFIYSDENGNPIDGISDTVITKYQITPQFRFILQ